MPQRKKIKLTFLGTGTSTGVPVISCDCQVCTSSNIKDKRLRTSAMIEVNGTVIIIDCGPDFRYQMIKADVQDIHALLFTHEHRDHIAGIDDIRAFNYVLNKPVDVFATEQVMDSIRTQFPYIFNNNGYFGAPKINVHTIESNSNFYIQGIEVTPIEAMHDQLPVLGFRIGDLTYITDASYIEDKEIEKIKGTKALVINALRNSKHISHFSLEQAVEIAMKAEAENVYFTHMSHFIGLHDRVNEQLPKNMQLAYDGQVVLL